MGERSIIPLVRQIADRVDQVRLLYLYPSDLTDALIDTICDTGVPYFDLSLQHVSPPLMRRMRRWGDGERFLRRITDIRAREPEAAFRSNFIVGYPGETEDDHDALLDFVEQAQLDWCGFFAYSPEAGTYAMELDGEIDTGLRDERLAESPRARRHHRRKRDLLVGSRSECSWMSQESVGVTASPEIDGVVVVPDTLEVGDFHDLTVTATMGPDVEAS